MIGTPKGQERRLRFGGNSAEISGGFKNCFFRLVCDKVSKTFWNFYTLVYPVYPCLPLSYCIPCIPFFILCTHVYPCHTVTSVSVVDLSMKLKPTVWLNSGELWGETADQNRGGFEHMQMTQCVILRSPWITLCKISSLLWQKVDERDCYLEGRPSYYSGNSF